MLACQYPTLPLALVHKVIAFYLERRSEVDDYVTSYQRDMLIQRDTSESVLDMTALRGRLDALQTANASSSN